jgi:hypothetical protein
MVVTILLVFVCATRLMFVSSMSVVVGHKKMPTWLMDGNTIIPTMYDTGIYELLYFSSSN